jgi:hypothetical protein
MLRSLVLALAALVATPLPGATAIFTVDSEADAPDAAQGDGACASAADGCTLRAAAEETNALPGPDSIGIPEGTYALSLGALALTDPVSLEGLSDRESVSIVGDGSNAVLGISVPEFSQSTVAHVSIRGGQRSGILTFGRGFGHYDSDLYLNDVLVEENRGPGVWVGAQRVWITDSLIRANDNTTIGFLGALRGGGVNLDEFADVRVSRSTITGNVARFGGGIGVEGDLEYLSIEESTISDNSAESGGGVSGGSSCSSVTRSTISGNTAARFGGGVRGSACFFLDDSTVSGNRAGERGGGLYLGSGTSVTFHSISHSTILENEAPVDAGLSVGTCFNLDVDLHHTILARNLAGSAASDCNVPREDPSIFCEGITFELNDNLLGDGSTCVANGTGVGEWEKECRDGIDDDGDGAVDWPEDRGCRSRYGLAEAPECDDGIDNDGDGAVDWDCAGVAPRRVQEAFGAQRSPADVIPVTSRADRNLHFGQRFPLRRARLGGETASRWGSSRRSTGRRRCGGFRARACRAWRRSCGAT